MRCLDVASACAHLPVYVVYAVGNITNNIDWYVYYSVVIVVIDNSGLFCVWTLLS
jgi:hypothetical protein